MGEGGAGGTGGRGTKQTGDWSRASEESGRRNGGGGMRDGKPAANCFPLPRAVCAEAGTVGASEGAEGDSTQRAGERWTERGPETKWCS